MTRDELELMREMRQVCNDVPTFVLAFTSGELSPDEERAFSQLWAGVAEKIAQHAEERRRLVIEGDVEPAARELEP